MAVQQTIQPAEAVDFRPNLDLITGVVQRPREEPVRTSALDVISAAFQNENSLVSALSFIGDMSGPMRPVEGYSSWEEIKGTEYEPFWDQIAGSQSPAETAAFKARIDRERENDRTLAAAGMGGFIAEIAAGLIDPTILIPVGGGLVKSGQAAWSIGRSALRVGAAGAAGVAIQEGLLQSTQETRTATESALNIGAGAVLSGILGGSFAAILSRAESRAASKAINVINGYEAPPRSTSVGAEQVQRATLDDLTMSSAEGFGTAAENTARSTQVLNPGLQLQFSPVARAREVGQGVAENTLFQRMNDEGRTTGASAETDARVLFRSRVATASREIDAIFKDGKKTGFGMTRQQFEEAAAAAARRGDQGPNDFVSRAAQAWRKAVFEPFQQDALDLGILTPEQIAKIKDPSYFPRQYKRKAMVERGREFVDRIANFYEPKLAGQYAEGKEALRKRVENIERRLADIRMTPADRTAALAQLETQGKQFMAANAEQAARVDRINDLRTQKKAATTAGDRTLAERLQASIAAEQAAGGERLKGFLADRQRLRQRERDVNLNFAGLDARHDKIMQSLVDIEEANLASLNRLIGKGRKLERDLNKLDPEAARERMSELRTAFIQLADKADKALDRQAEALRALDEKAAKDIAAGKPADEVTAAKDKAQRARVERELAAQRNRSERMSSLAQRMEAADEFDLDATVRELQDGVDQLVKEVSDLTLARGEKAQRLKDRLENLDPAKLDAKVKELEARKLEAERRFAEQWERSLDLDGVGFKTAAREIADNAYAKLTGTDYGMEGQAFADNLVPITRGPLKDRTLDVPDELIEDFLESNIREVGERYARAMSSEIALTRKFGRADMRDQIAAIADDYKEMMDAVSGGRPGQNSTDMLKAEALAAYKNSTGKTKITDAELLKWLDARRAQDIKNIEALRDIQRGSYMREANASFGGQVARGLMTFNYVRSMGGVLISSLGDLYRPAMVHGLGPFLRDGIGPLLTNIKAAKLSTDDARLMGLVSEMHLQDRMMTMSELGDPYRQGAPIERFMANSTRIASNWNGINLLTDFAQGVAARVSQNRILTAAIGKKDKRLMAYLGIDAEMAERIAQQFAEHGDTVSGVKVANTQAWTDDAARRAYQNAVTKDVDSVVVRKGIADTPLLANHPMGRVLLQFRSYAMASHQRVLLRGLQESKGRFVGGLVGMSSIGMLVAALGAWRSGDEGWERFQQKASSNPGYLIGEGLDRSGIFALGVEVGNVTETVTRDITGGEGFNPVKSPLLLTGRLVNPEASAAPASGKTFNRGWADALAGPTVGLFNRDLPAAASVAGSFVRGEEATPGQERRAAATVPFGSYLGFKEVLQALQGDSPYAPDQ